MHITILQLIDLTLITANAIDDDDDDDDNYDDTCYHCSYLRYEY